MDEDLGDQLDQLAARERRADLELIAEVVGALRPLCLEANTAAIDRLLKLLEHKAEMLGYKKPEPGEGGASWASTPGFDPQQVRERLMWRFEALAGQAAGGESTPEGA